MKQYDWKYQQKANKDLFLEDAEYAKKKNTLMKIQQSFDTQEIEWALCCSSNLFFRGITDGFDDYDILVTEKDAKKAKEIMENLGGTLKAIEYEDKNRANKCCRSNIYMKFYLDEVQIEIISGFRVLTFETNYLYELAMSQIERESLDEFTIPLLETEVQLILYAMMEGWQPQRRLKRLLIENFLEDNDNNFFYVLEQAIKSPSIPAWIKQRIRKFVKKGSFE